MYRVNRFYILIILLRCDEKSSTLKTFKELSFTNFHNYPFGIKHSPFASRQWSGHCSPVYRLHLPVQLTILAIISSYRTASFSIRSILQPHSGWNTFTTVRSNFSCQNLSLNIFEKQASKQYPCKSSIWLRVRHFWRTALCIHPIAMARALLVQDTIVKIRTARQFDFLYAGVYNLVPNHSFPLSRGECVCIINLNPVPSSLSNRCRSVSTTDDVFYT